MRAAGLFLLLIATPTGAFLYAHRCIDFRVPASTPPCPSTLASPAL